MQCERSVRTFCCTRGTHHVSELAGIGGWASLVSNIHQSHVDQHHLQVTKQLEEDDLKIHNRWQKYCKDLGQKEKLHRKLGEDCNSDQYEAFRRRQMRIKSVFCKMGWLLQGEGKGSRVLWRQQLLWRKWGNGSRSDGRSCLCASTHDT